MGAAQKTVNEDSFSALPSFTCGSNNQGPPWPEEEDLVNNQLIKFQTSLSEGCFKGRDS